MNKQKDSFSDLLKKESFFLLMKLEDNIYSNTSMRNIFFEEFEILVNLGLKNIEICWSKNKNWIDFVSDIKIKYPRINLGSASIVNKKSIEASDGEIKNIDELMNIPFGSLFTKNLIALSDSPPPPGYYIHEVGGAPMGINEENSVVDKFNRLWRCKNVLVLDGACWPTSSWQSPTLTMMALSRRACLNIKKT